MLDARSVAGCSAGATDLYPLFDLGCGALTPESDRRERRAAAILGNPAATAPLFSQRDGATVGGGSCWLRATPRRRKPALLRSRRNEDRKAVLNTVPWWKRED
jgi:hypothetical protein